ncbi:acyltransferase family protein [Microbacterium sp.]|uniref:acyltransferase family protein n=1 Tax=Microbacterium sp. TaxID=51671 RepID=UPI0039E297AC
MHPNSPAEPTRARRPGYIAEIEGVRGLALTLVVLFHLFGQGRVSGGVDVFLLISGFLLTRSMLKRTERPGERFLTAHFGRVLLRLVPAALVVLIFTAVMTLLIAPTTRWVQTGRELIASALYYENWELIGSQLSYGAAGPSTSPLQHFWSLSVQGQFFLIWPFLVLALAVLARRLGGRPATWVWIVTAVATIASFAYAIALTGLDQPVAYFNSFTRFWEIGVGCLLAFVAGRLTLPPVARIVLGWTGLALIVTSGFFIDGAHLFPGVWTLWPIIGVSLVILSSGEPTRVGPDRMLEWAPLRFFARISYPLYLWHWPILIAYLEYRDQSRVGLLGAVVVLTISIALAWATQRFIAEPALRLRVSWRPRATLLAPTAALLSVVLVVGAGVFTLERAREAELATAAAPSSDHPGARALTEDPPPTWDTDTPFRPSVDAAFDDLPDLYERGCVQKWRSEPGMDEVLTCEDDSVKSPRRTIVMSGGSHVLHWYPALKAVAEARGWSLVVVDKDGCRLTTRAGGKDGLSESCHSWNDKAIPYLIDLHPDAVFTVATKTPEVEGDVEISYPGQVDAWARLAEGGVPVIAIRDTPRFLGDVPECVEENAGDPASCGRDRGDVFLPTSPVRDEPGLSDEVTLLDLSDAFCTQTRCDPIVGNVLAYRDQDHMTATYSATLATALDAALREAAPWLD